MSKILICGGTGLIGSKLIQKLKQKNHEIVLLTTQKSKTNSKDIYYWDPSESYIDSNAFNNVDVIINFSGQGIFDKNFTDSRKIELEESRTKAISCLFDHIKTHNINIQQFITASATGYYPNICSDKLNETSTKGTGFISDLVEKWEQSTAPFQTLNTPVTIIRIGIVLSTKGGFLKQLSTPISYFAGAIPGNGKQSISWIHIDDLCDLFIWTMEQKLSGTFNGTAPNPESITSITKGVAKLLNRPLLAPNIPVFMLKLIFGKERHLLLLSSQNVSSEKIVATGFQFKFPYLDNALQNLYEKES